MENGKKPINPIVASNGFVTNEINYNNRGLNGLTKREYFAGIAMQGLLSNPEFIKGGSFDFKSRGTEERLSSISTKLADELLKQIEI